MTDDRLEKVRKEIERLLAIADHRIDNNRYTIDETGLDEDESARVHAIQKSELTYLNGEAFAYQKVLSFIDSMQEEPEPHYPSFEESQGEVILYGINGSVGMQEKSRFHVGQTIADPTDPTFTFHINMIEDGKYIESYDSWVLIKDADEEYQLVEEPESEDLEQAAKEWLRPQLDKSYVNYGEAKMMELTRFDGYAMLDAIEFGANWKEQQFEKNRLKHCNSITNEHD